MLLGFFLPVLEPPRIDAVSLAVFHVLDQFGLTILEPMLPPAVLLPILIVTLVSLLATPVPPRVSAVADATNVMLLDTQAAVVVKSAEGSVVLAAAVLNL